MKHKAIATSLALSCGLAFALAAQNPAGGTKSQDPSGGSKSQAKETSLTGCLEAGTVPNTFVLKNVSAETSAGSEAKPTELAKTESEYALTPAGKVNLKDHLGHKVEVTGVILAQKQGKRGGSDTTPMSRFRVKSVKEVSTDCP